MRVTANILEETRENEYGTSSPVTVARCSRCDHETWAWGHHGGSRTAALTQLREQCPKNEENYYDG